MQINYEKQAEDFIQAYMRDLMAGEKPEVDDYIDEYTYEEVDVDE